MRRLLILSLAAIALLALPAPAEAATVTIDAQDNKFVPADATAAPGDTVVFKNSGNAVHNAKSKDGSVDIPIINAGQEKSVVVTKAGDIAYVCTFHETLGMKGTLRVAAAGAGPTTPPTAVPTPVAPPTPDPATEADSPPTDEEPVADEGGGEGEEPEETEEELAAADAPPSQKYFPFLALALLALLVPMVALPYRRLMKAPTGQASGSPPAKPSE